MAESTFTSPVLSLEVADHVGTLWLDRPEQLNAMGPDLWRDLPLAVAALDEDPEVRVIILAAKGRHFSVGLDLKAMGALLTGPSGGGGHASSVQRAAATYRDIVAMQASVSSLANTTKPVIAAIHGYCIGGGVDLAAACDIRLATADAVFSVREAKVAIVADLGSLQRLPRIVNAGHVAELAYTGKDIDAARAEKIGLLNDIYPTNEDLMTAARSLAREIAANSPLAVQGTKSVLQAGDGATVEEGLEFVARWNTMFLQSNDLAEAMTAFLEKREPKFSGS